MTATAIPAPADPGGPTGGRDPAWVVPGDPATTFTRLFERLHRPIVSWFISGCGCNPQEAQDLAGEAFAKAWEALPRALERRPFYPRGWLNLIALNVWRDHARHHGLVGMRSLDRMVAASPGWEPRAYDPSDAADDPEELVMRREERRLVRRRIAAAAQTRTPAEDGRLGGGMRARLAVERRTVFALGEYPDLRRDWGATDGAIKGVRRYMRRRLSRDAELARWVAAGG